MAKKYYLDGRIFKPGPGRNTSFIGQANPKNLNDIILEVVGTTLPIVPATTTVQGITELATNAEAIAKASTTVVLTPSNLAALGASTTFAGLTEFSTDAEALAKVSTTTALTPSNLAALGASETFAGLVELATDAEAIAGVSTSVAITPANLTAALSTAGDLESVLTNGSTTGANNIEISDGQVVTAVNGAGTLNLRNGADGQVSITSDAGVYGEGWFDIFPTYGAIGFGSNTYVEVTTARAGFIHNTATAASYIGKNFIGLNLYANEAAISKNIGIFPNSLAIASTSSDTGGVSINSGTVANPTTFNIGIYQSPALGGEGITVKTAFTAYANQLGLNANGSAFETLIDTSTLTADRTAEFPDASGSINLTRVVAINTPTVHTATTGEVVLVTTGAGALVVNLPVAVINYVITIKKVDAGAGAVTVTPAGIATIDGAATYSLAAQYNSVTLVCDGVEWFVTAVV